MHYGRSPSPWLWLIQVCWCPGLEILYSITVRLEPSHKLFKKASLSGADPENSERGGRFPPSHPRMTNSLSGHAAYSTVGVFVMQSKVTLTFRSEDRIKEHFIIRFSKQTLGVSGRKKGGCGPLGPSSKSAFAFHSYQRKIVPTNLLVFFRGLTMTCYSAS